MKSIGIRLFPQNVRLCALINMLLKWLIAAVLVCFVALLTVYIERSCIVVVGYLTYRFQRFAAKNIRDEYKDRPENYWFAISTTVWSMILTAFIWEVSIGLPTVLSGILARNIWTIFITSFFSFLIESMFFAIVTIRQPSERLKLMPSAVFSLVSIGFLALINLLFLTQALWLSMLLATQIINLYQWVLYKRIGLKTAMCGFVSTLTSVIVQPLANDWLLSFDNKPIGLMIRMNAVSIAFIASILAVSITLALTHFILKSYSHNLDMCSRAK